LTDGKTVLKIKFVSPQKPHGKAAVYDSDVLANEELLLASARGGRQGLVRGKNQRANDLSAARSTWKSVPNCVAASARIICD
jgi:hypothetical protein